jgi:deoxyguanosine kinase
VKKIQKTVFLSLGSNLGNRMKNLVYACKELMATGDNFSFSSVYETEAWGFKTDQQFLNLVIRFETVLEPEELLQTIQAIEIKLGRTRNILNTGYDSRIIDIDILFFGDKIINTQDLVVPHPKLQYRKFVLLPLCEIAANNLHPVMRKTFIQLLSECTDTGNVIFKNKITLT